MSVDIARLSSGLPPEQQKAVARVYRQRAKDPTTAFLLCFFLGIFGAHCFYLGKTGQGVLRLIISPLIIPGLIWEIFDLFRIDGEVYERNLKLGEQLVAEAMLAAPPAAAEQEAIRRLDQVIQEQEQQERAQATAAAAPAVAAFAASTAPEQAPVADAAAEYTPAATSSGTSGEPETPGAAPTPEAPMWPIEAAAAAAAVTALAAGQAGADAQQPAANDEPPTAPWPAQSAEPAAPALEYAEPVPAAPEWPASDAVSWAAPSADTVATQQAPTDWGQVAGAEVGGSTEDAPAWSAGQTSGSGDEVPAEAAYPWPEARPISPEPAESGPLWAKPPALMAEAGLAGASALAATDIGAASPAESAAPEAAPFASTWPEQPSPAPAWQTPPDASPSSQQPAQPEVFAEESPSDTFATESGPDDIWAAITPEAVAAAALAANQVAPLRRTTGFDVTDQAADVGDPGYVADIGEGGQAGRIHVTMPPDQPLPGSYAFDAAPSQDVVAEEYVAAPYAAEPQPAPPADAGTGDVASETLLLVPLAEAAAATAGPADAAAVADVAGQAPGAEPQAQAAAPVGDYESHVTEEVHDQGSQGGRRVVKRVRVVRRLMVNGQVVQETSAEQVVDADADTAATAASLQQTMGTADPETLARLAGTLPDNYVVQKADQSQGSAGPGSTGQTGQTGSGGAGQGGA